MPELVTAPTFREQVLTHLRDRIMSGELPPGALLTPTAVAKELNTSAMPVREALRTLEQEGLVEVAGRRYTRVATPSRALADEAYPLLGLLEGHAIRQSKPGAHANCEQAERANAALLAASGLAARMRAMFEFHRAICSASGPINRSLLEVLYARVGLLESVYARGREPAVAVKEHHEIVTALRAGDFEHAADLNEQHWLHGYQDTLDLIDASSWSADAPTARISRKRD